MFCTARLDGVVACRVQHRDSLVHEQSARRNPLCSPTNGCHVISPRCGAGLQYVRRPRRLCWRLVAVPDSAAGGGGSSGGGGSTNGGGGGEDDGSGGSNLASNIWVLVVAAAATLGLFRVGSKKLQLRHKSLPELDWQQVARRAAEGSADWLQARKDWLQSQSQDWLQGKEMQQRKQWVQSKLAAVSALQPASTEDVATLARLTQEAFAEMVKVKERLDALEQDAGLSSGIPAPADASPVSGGSGSSNKPHRGVAANSESESASGIGSAPQHHARHRLVGVLRLGGGLLWAEEGEDAAAGEAVRAAGMKLGTDVLLQLSGLVRDGRDSMHAECKVNPAAEQLSLRKVLYSCRLSPYLRVVLAPFGARGRDAAYTLNPLASQGLTSMVQDGSPLHRPVLGSLVGLGLEASRAWLNAGYFARASPEGAAACSLLAQAVVAPFNSLSVGATYLEHRSEVPAGSDAAAADASSSGGIRPAMVGALRRVAPFAAVCGDSERQLGATLAWRLGDTAVVHGWVAADGKEVESRVRSGQLAKVRPRQWGLLLGSYPDGSGSGWVFGMGRSAAVQGAADGSGSRQEPNLFELSLQFNMGDGLLLTPGMLLMKQSDGRYTAFLGLKSGWTF